MKQAELLDRLKALPLSGHELRIHYRDGWIGRFNGDEIGAIVPNLEYVYDVENGDVPVGAKPVVGIRSKYADYTRDWIKSEDVESVEVVRQLTERIETELEGGYIVTVRVMEDGAVAICATYDGMMGEDSGDFALYGAYLPSEIMPIVLETIQRLKAKLDTPEASRCRTIPAPCRHPAGPIGAGTRP